MSFLPRFSFDPYCAPTGSYDPQYNWLLVGTQYVFQHPPSMASPSSVVSTTAEATPGRSKWGKRLTFEIREKLGASREELETDSVAKLMTATGASRSNVRTWLRSPAAPVKLGRPSFFSEKEEDVIAHYMAAWTKGGDILTCAYASVLLGQYIGDVGRVEEAELRFDRGGMPGRSYF